MTITDRLSGIRGSLAYKAPVKAATTADITLSAEQTIDGVSIEDGEYVLVKNQNTGSENGIYVASTGDWQRRKDFNGTGDAVKGTRVFVTDGTVAGGRRFRVTTSNPITIDTTALSFSPDVATDISFTPAGDIEATTVQDAIEELDSEKATLALDNLASVAINTTLLPGTDDGAGLGSGAKSFSDLFLASGGVVNFNNGDITLTHSANGLDFAGGAFRFPNTGLQAYDTDGSHVLALKPGSNQTADRTLTFATGDADRTVTLDGNPTLDDWFDQSVKQAASPTFAGLTLNGSIGGTGVGIDDNDVVTVDATAGAPNDDEYARFTATGIEGRTEAEFKADFNLEIGTDVQAWDADLDDIAALSSADGNFIVGSATGWVVESGATVRTSLGLAIGSDVQAFDADTLKADTADTLTAGFKGTSHNLGTITGANQTTTPNVDNGNVQHATLNGSSLTGTWTVNPPTGPTTCMVEITNGGTGDVGASIDTTAFDKVDGAWAPTNGNVYQFHMAVSNSKKYLSIVDVT